MPFASENCETVAAASAAPESGAASATNRPKMERLRVSDLVGFVVGILIRILLSILGTALSQPVPRTGLGVRTSWHHRDLGMRCGNANHKHHWSAFPSGRDNTLGIFQPPLVSS